MAMTIRSRNFLKLHKSEQLQSRVPEFKPRYWLYEDSIGMDKGFDK